MDKYFKEILSFIGRKPEGVSFYQLVRGFGFPDAPFDLQAVLQILLEERLAVVRQPDAGVNTRYGITEKGKIAIAEESGRPMGG